MFFFIYILLKKDTNFKIHILFIQNYKKIARNMPTIPTINIPLII